MANFGDGGKLIPHIVSIPYCIACETPMALVKHRGVGHAEPAWACTDEDCAHSGTCLSCQRALEWFHQQDQELGDA